MVHEPVLVHCLRVVAHRTLRLIRADLSALGVPDSENQGVNLPRTQAIGAAAAFLGCDGRIAPSARWDCENLMLFPERMDADATPELMHSETVDWLAWGAERGMRSID